MARTRPLSSNTLSVAAGPAKAARAPKLWNTGASTRTAPLASWSSCASHRSVTGIIIVVMAVSAWMERVQPRACARSDCRVARGLMISGSVCTSMTVATGAASAASTAAWKPSSERTVWPSAP